jgi:phage shock protein C
MEGGMNSNVKRLWRSRTNKTVFGIFGGLGNYFSVDPTLLRVLFVLFLIITAVAPLTLAYFVAYFIIPLEA